MKFANLVLQSPIIRSRHDLLPAAGRDQAALRHQPTPGEQLVWGNAMPTSHQAYRHTRLEGLFDHANLLRGRPAPTTLNRRDDLNAIGRIGHRHGCMPHTCQVGDRVRSVRGLSQMLPDVIKAALLEELRFAKRQQWTVTAAVVALIAGAYNVAKSLARWEKVVAAIMVVVVVAGGIYWLLDLQGTRLRIDPYDRGAGHRGLDVVYGMIWAMILSAAAVC